MNCDVLKVFCKELRHQDPQEPIRVFDTGRDVFGDFENVQQAIAAIERSNPDWWDLSEWPSWEFLKNVEEDL